MVVLTVEYKKITDFLSSPVSGIIAILIYLVIAIVIGSYFGIGGSFIKFGPNDDLIMFKTVINTWPSYIIVMYLVIQNQCIMTYALQTISPWILNQVQNKDKIIMDYNNVSIYIMIGLWTSYMWVGNVLGTQIGISQIDFILAVGITDIITTLLVIRLYLIDKMERNSVLPYTNIN